MLSFLVFKCDFFFKKTKILDKASVLFCLLHREGRVLLRYWKLAIRCGGGGKRDVSYFYSKSRQFAY